MSSSNQKGPVTVTVFGRTDVGRTREHNEDAFVVVDLTRNNATLQPEVRTHTVGERGTLFMVADGMGGAAAGEIASAMAIDVVVNELLESFESAPSPESEIFASSIKRATAIANSRIHQFALEHPEYRGMGTTATIAGVHGDTLYLAQVGDSRGYLVRNGKPIQITKDQSLMQKLIEAGEITEEEAELSERRNIILQALGPEANIKVDLTFQKLRKGDTLVLCSDGLSGQVKLEEIGRVVAEEPDLMTVCKRLIDRANENGGPDNITVIAARFDGEGLLNGEVTDDSVGHHVFQLSTDSGSTPAAARPTAPAPAAEEAHRPTVKLPSMELPSLPEELVPTVVPETRRTKGSMIMLGLVVAGLIVAVWAVYNMANTVVQKKQGAAPAPAASP